MDLTAEIANGHGYLGYGILLSVVAVVAYALVKARSGEPYTEGPGRLVGLLLALQWVYGIIVYIQIGGWNGDPLLAYVHPLAMTGAVAMAGIATSRARILPDEKAWTTVARVQGIALGLVGIGVLAAIA